MSLSRLESLKRLSRSDYSLDPSESPELDPQQIRAVRLDVCLARWGKHFQTSGGGAMQCNADFDLSQVVDFIDDFLSHDWKTSRFDKFLAMIFTYNFRTAMFASGVVSCLTGVLRIHAPMGNHWWPVVFGYVAFGLTLCCWQQIRCWFCKPRLVFLDRLCIPQNDEILKRRGILRLPSFLHHSERLTILWSPRWISRLWCVFELATFLRKNSKGKPIQLVPVKMGRVLLLQTMCWVAIAVTHAFMLDIMSPQFQTNGSDENIPQIRQRLFEFYLFAFSIFGIIILLTLPPLMYLGQAMIQELAKLPVQLKSFRVQDCECFCCTNSHQDPTGETLPCDRLLVHRMLKKWFSKSRDQEDDLSYVDRFNKVVRDELSIVMSSAGGNTLRFRDALYAAGGCTFPWISDFIPWWANSELTGLPFFLWFLRGFMLWSYNGLVMMIMMRGCIIAWKVSLRFLDRVPRVMLLLAQAAAMLVLALCVWLPFRWWYVTTDDLSLLPIVPYSTAIVFAICLFRCHCEALQLPAPTPQLARQIGHPQDVYGGFPAELTDSPSEAVDSSSMDSQFALEVYMALKPSTKTREEIFTETF